MKTIFKNNHSKMVAINRSACFRAKNLKGLMLGLSLLAVQLSYGQTNFNNPVQISTFAGLADPAIVTATVANGTLQPTPDLTLNQLGPSAVWAKLTLSQLIVANPSYLQTINPTCTPVSGGFKFGQTPNATLAQIRQEENANMEFWTNGLVAGAAAMTINNLGWVGIGTAAPFVPPVAFTSSPVTGGPPNWGWLAGGAVAVPLLSVAGDIETANGSGVYSTNFFIYSDERLKQNFNPLTDWRKILDVNTYSFSYRDFGTNKPKNGLSYGFKAQEIYKLLPELTSNSGPILAVDYVSFIPFLTEGLKDHEKQLKRMEVLLKEQPNGVSEKITALEIENRQLKERLDNLETTLNAIMINNNGGKIEENNPQRGTLIDRPRLEQNEPNPFTETTEIHYFLPEGNTNASIIVKNNEGSLVGDFTVSNFGYGFITINPGTLMAGIYNYSLVINGSIIDTKKMTLIK